ncbi:MAG: hypothetical protein K8H74_17865 [Notoacmeibacter sp.]|nr:hypothetical protein [Notoacmeibacter sp.]
MAETKKRQPLLDLTTLIERPTIAIDGKSYEILSPDELSILDTQRFENWGREIQALCQDEERGEELNALIDTVAARIMTGVPDDVAAKLTSAHRMRVIAVFTGLLLGDQVAAAGATLKAMNRSTGERSSPASSGSSAVRQAGGSKKRRRRS